MALQIKYKDSEGPNERLKIIERQVIANISRLKDSESEGIIIPDELITELGNFAYRNAINVEYTIHEFKKEKLGVVCQRCLKAHLMNKAQKIGLSGEVLAYLDIQIPGMIGHEGYYLDEGNVKHSS